MAPLNYTDDYKLSLYFPANADLTNAGNPNKSPYLSGTAGTRLTILEDRARNYSHFAFSVSASDVTITQNYFDTIQYAHPGIVLGFIENVSGTFIIVPMYGHGYFDQASNEIKVDLFAERPTILP